MKKLTLLAILCASLSLANAGIVTGGFKYADKGGHAVAKGLNKGVTVGAKGLAKGTVAVVKTAAKIIW